MTIFFRPPSLKTVVRKVGNRRLHFVRSDETREALMERK